MALVWASSVCYPGRAGIQSDFPSIQRGGRGKSTTVRAIDLAASAYDAGGWVLKPGDVRLSAINGLDMICDLDPKGNVVDAAGVMVRLDRSTVGTTKLRLYTASATEAAGASTRPGVLWLRFYGRRD